MCDSTPAWYSDRRALSSRRESAMLQYYGRWIWTAFRRSFGWAEAIASFIGLWILPFIKATTGREIPMTDAVVGQVLFGVLLSLVSVRLLLAPYWMHKEDDAKAAADRKERDALAVRLRDGEARARFDEAHTRLGHIRDTLLRQADSAQKSNGLVYKPAENQTWLMATKQMLKDSLAPAACKRLRTFPSNCDRKYFEQTVASLRTLASDLRTEDLKRQ